MKTDSVLKQGTYYKPLERRHPRCPGLKRPSVTLSSIFPYDFLNFCYSRLQDTYNATYADRVPALHVGFQ